MNKKNIFVLFFCISVFSMLIIANYLASKEKNEYYNEQLELGVAMELISEEKFSEAKDIMDKYINDKRYKNASSITVNYALLLLKLNEENIEYYLKIGYNSNPYILMDPKFIDTFNLYLDNKGVFNEK